MMIHQPTGAPLQRPAGTRCDQQLQRPSTASRDTFVMSGSELSLRRYYICIYIYMICLYIVCGFVFFVHLHLPIDVPSYFFVSLSILGFCVYIYMYIYIYMHMYIYTYIYIYSCPSGRHQPQSFIETQTLRFWKTDTKKTSKKWT